MDWTSLRGRHPLSCPSPLLPSCPPLCLYCNSEYLFPPSAQLSLRQVPFKRSYSGNSFLLARRGRAAPSLRGKFGRPLSGIRSTSSPPLWPGHGGLHAGCIYFSSTLSLSWPFLNFFPPCMSEALSLSSSPRCLFLSRTVDPCPQMVLVACPYFTYGDQERCLVVRVTAPFLRYSRFFSFGLSFFQAYSIGL